MKILSLRNCLDFPAVIYWIIRMLFLLLCKSYYDSIFLNPGSRSSEGCLSLIFAFTSVDFLPYDLSSNFKRDSVSLSQLVSSSQQVHWFVPELAGCSMIRTKEIALLRPKADHGFAQRQRIAFWIVLNHSGWSRTLIRLFWWRQHAYTVSGGCLEMACKICLFDPGWNFRKFTVSWKYPLPFLVLDVLFFSPSQTFSPTPSLQLST